MLSSDQNRFSISLLPRNNCMQVMIPHLHGLKTVLNVALPYVQLSAHGMQTAHRVIVRIIALECPSYNGSGYATLSTIKIRLRYLWKLRNVWKTCLAGPRSEKIVFVGVWKRKSMSLYGGGRRKGQISEPGRSRAWQIYWRLVYQESSLLYKYTEFQFQRHQAVLSLEWGWF